MGSDFLSSGRIRRIAKAEEALYNHKHFIIDHQNGNCNQKGAEDMAWIPEDVRSVLERLEMAGYEAWCVGGCIRDLRLGKSPEDWDVTTSARPEEISASFGELARPTGARHGTVTVRTGVRDVEVTTFRTDGVYLDHRRPEHVFFTRSLEEDLGRRDFTINAMAMDLRGQLRDPFGGAEDLAAGVLRCVGRPDQRFQEDALRLLRGLRFLSRLGLTAAPDTDAAIHEHRTLLEAIAPERIQAELRRLLCGDDAAQVLRTYPDVVAVFWPEISPMIGFDQHNRHHCFDVWEHTLHALEVVAPDPVLRYAMVLHDIGKPACFTMDPWGNGHFRGHPAVSKALADDMLRRLRLDNATRESVLRLVEWHDRDIPRTERGVLRALRALGEQDLRRLFAVKRADNLAQAPEYRGVQAEIQKAEEILDQALAGGACWSLRQLAVRGGDLVSMGYQGRAIGQMLETLLDAVEDGTLPNEKEALLEYARHAEGANETGDRDGEPSGSGRIQ